MKFAVLDIECTCWRRGTPHHNNNAHETIEIGMIFLDADFKKVDQLDLYTLPMYNKTLSDYCIDLTGITQKYLNANAIPFPNAMKIIAETITKDTIFCSWGDFDKRQLQRDCEEWDIPFPFSDEHINIKKEFMDKYKRKKAGLQKACRILSLRFEGAPHNGLADANMTSQIFRRLRKSDLDGQ